jgi:hypothetical protein
MNVRRLEINAAATKSVTENAPWFQRRNTIVSKSELHKTRMKKSNTIIAIILCNIRSLPFISISVYPECTINGYPVRRFFKNQKVDGIEAERDEGSPGELSIPLSRYERSIGDIFFIARVR